MNTKLLKQKILDLAIHGKLVPQNPEDEPASVLLEKVRAEKEEKIRKGEIKRDKKDSYIFVDENGKHFEKFGDGSVKNVQDEIPFQLPNGWSWCKLPSLCEIPITDGTHKTPIYSNEREGIPFLSSKDITKLYIDWSNIKYITKDLHEELHKRTAPRKNDILLAKNGTTGVAALVEDNTVFDIYVTLALIRLNLNYISPKYIFHILNSFFCKNQFNDHLTGIGVPNLHLIDINKTIIPLPPLAEQQRIVEQIEKIFAQIDYIEQNQTDLSTLVKQAKSKILDLAIHGKLVEQNPQEESATVLLEKIRAEKEAKIKAGELKRDKKDSHIIMYNGKHCEKFADGSIVEIEKEIPFELPEGWCWCRLKDPCLVTMGTSPEGTAVSSGKDGLEFHQGKIYFTDKYLRKSDLKTTHITKIADAESILLCVRAPVGVVNITERQICIGRGLCAIHPNYEISSDFWFNWIKYQKSNYEQQATGTTFKAISVDVIKNTLIPLPPLEEQKRIVDKIKNLFGLLDSIEVNLN